MPHHSVHLPPELDEFFVSRITSGRYASSSELLQAALRALDREERASEAKRAAAHEALYGAPAQSLQEGDVFRKLWLAQFNSSPRL